MPRWLINLTVVLTSEDIDPSTLEAIHLHWFSFLPFLFMHLWLLLGGSVWLSFNSFKIKISVQGLSKNHRVFILEY